jgi:hypothetical protein
MEHTGNEKRKYIRHPLSYPLRTKVLTEKNGNPVVKSSAENIGAGGLLFRSSVAMNRDAEVEINLSIEGRKFLLDGTVVRCDPVENGNYNVAVSFNRQDEVLKVRMMEQIVRIEEFKERLEHRCKKKLNFAWVAKLWIKRYSKGFADHYDL